MAADLRIDLRHERRGVETALKRLLAAERGIPARLKAAMRHSLLAGGKRLRPILVLWTWDATRTRGAPVTDRAMVLETACAVEMLHTYSLIHDDLPAMDDDVLRRGRPTCHVAFDEATAILAGDGLQSLAFQILARSGGARSGELVELVARAIGPAGMVGGQQRDLDAEGKPVTGRQVQQIHREKTGCLLAAAVGVGALLAGRTGRGLAELQDAALDLGLAFQAIDDVLDVTASAQTLGKSPGKDEAAGKATWVAVEGLEKAARRARRLGRRGQTRLERSLIAGEARDRLLDLGRLMWERES